MRAIPKLFLLIAALLMDHEPCRAANEATLTQSSSVPIAKLQNFTFRDIWSPSRWKSPREANTVDFRALIPYKLWETPNLLRVTVPYRTEFEAFPGLGDTRI